MRAWLMESFDGVEHLRLGEVPDPRPGPGEVLLGIRFAALNPADAFLAQGQYPAKPPLPHILGRDGAGEVIAVGPDVKNVKVGDIRGILRCDAGVTRWGTLAEKTVVEEVNLAPAPEGWTIEEMAAAPLTFLTAWQALTQWSDPPAPPPAGSVVLVTGASGGVGVATVMLGRSMGLTVAALSRSEAKRAKLRELGADLVFDPADPELKKKFKSQAPRPVDIAVDNVAGPLFNQVIAMMGYQGRISVVGRSGGPVPEFNTGTLFFRRLRVGGVAVGDYTPQQAQEAWREIVAAIGAKPVIDSISPFDSVKEAFRRLAEGPMGKVLIRL